MNEAECDTVIPAGRFRANRDAAAVLEQRASAMAAYRALAER